MPNERTDVTPEQVAQSGSQVVTQNFAYDGDRQVTVYIPPHPPTAVVFAADGQHASHLVAALEAAEVSSTVVVGVHGQPDDEGRFKEYLVGADAQQFAAHEKFFVEEVREWVRSSLGIALPPERTAVWGASLSGEFALAMGLRHQDIYGVVFSASPGGGYRPPTLWPGSIPRVYLLAGTQEKFFLENATRWADALRDAKADVVMMEREGEHGGEFWLTEFPLMVRWAFGN